MESRCCNVSEDVLEEIMSWLPPESLIRFKCVCKSWYSLINSLIKNPSFVNKHLHNIDKKKLCSTCLVFCCPRSGYCPDPELEFLSPFELYSLLTIKNDDNESNQLAHVSEDFDLPVLPSELDMASVFGCHCNGIICLTYYHRTLVLSNPATKQSRALPKPCLADDGFVMLGTGFGYDSRANDYKIVRFGRYRFLPGRVENPKPRAEVYSMGTDSWREVGIHLEFDCFPYLDREVFCKGVFYWSTRVHEYIIISFDIFDEVFCTISLLDNFQARDKRIKLAVWNDSLALFLYPQQRLEGIDGGLMSSVSIEVWVMNDCCNGVSGSYSWTKKLTIGPLVGIATPLTFWKSDELLMEAIDGGLVSYNLHSQKLRNLTIQGAERISSWAFPYVKSLVSVQGGNKLSHSADIGTRIM